MVKKKEKKDGGSIAFFLMPCSEQYSFSSTNPKVNFTTALHFHFMYLYIYMVLDTSLYLKRIVR